jgi:hypothetical protein
MTDQLFGVNDEQLAKAQRNVVAARTWPRTIVATATSQSFGTKLSRAVQTRRDMRATTRKQKANDDEKERNRYRKLQSRPRTKSD